MNCRVEAPWDRFDLTEPASHRGDDLGLYDVIRNIGDQGAFERIMKIEAEKRREAALEARTSALASGADPELDELLATGRLSEAGWLARERAKLAHERNDPLLESLYRGYLDGIEDELASRNAAIV